MVRDGCFEDFTDFLFLFDVKRVFDHYLDQTGDYFRDKFALLMCKYLMFFSLSRGIDETLCRYDVSSSSFY